MNPDKPLRRKEAVEDILHDTCQSVDVCPDCKIEIIRNKTPLGLAYYWCYKCNYMKILNKE